MGVTGLFHYNKDMWINKWSCISLQKWLAERHDAEGVNISPFQASCTQLATENCHQSRAICSDSSGTAQRRGYRVNRSERRQWYGLWFIRQSLQATTVKQGMGKRRQSGRTKQTHRKKERGRAKGEGGDRKRGWGGYSRNCWRKERGGIQSNGINVDEVKGREERELRGRYKRSEK